MNPLTGTTPSARLSSRAGRRLPAGLLFILPVMVLWGVWGLYPTLYTLYLSFTDWNLLGSHQIIGAENYGRMIGDPILRKAFLNSAMWVGLTLPGMGIISLGLAIAIQSTTKLRQFLRAAYFLPVVAPTAAVALVWTYLYQPHYGLFNSVLDFLGLPTSEWLWSPSSALPSLALLFVWKNIGFPLVIYLAALQAIPQSYYDAASVDGASWWRKVWHITLPQLRPVILFVLLTEAIYAFNTFTEVYVMTLGGPSRATTLVGYYQYEIAFKKLEMGYASAIGVVLSVLVMTLAVFTLSYLGRTRKEAEYV